MKTLFKVAAVVLVMGLSQGANAASYTFNSNTTTALGALPAGDTDFGAIFANASSAFNEKFTFSLPSTADVNYSYVLSFGQKGAKIAGISDSSFTYNLKDSANNAVTFDSEGTARLAATGLYTLEIAGTTGNTAFIAAAGKYNSAPIAGAVGNYGYVGSTLNVSPVPEAEEWAMMLLGLGMMGVVARRQKVSQNQIGFNEGIVAMPC